MCNADRQKNLILAFIFMLIFSFLMAGHVFSQTTATLEGKVTDQEGSVLPGTTVTVRNLETGYEYSAVARPDGRYIVSGIQPGKYEIEAVLTGFSTQIRRGLTLTLGSRLTIDFSLVPATIQQEITVTAEAPMVEVTKSEVGSVVDRKKIDDLPLYDRDFGTLAVLKPGVAEGRGNAQPRGGGEILIDGVSNEIIAAGATRTAIPADAIQEFRVITNQMQAEYGNAAGLVQSAITRSGTNELRGRLSFYYRDEAFDAVNYFVNHAAYKGPELDKSQYTKPKFEHLNYGGFLGGPIVKDKAHFFISYEGQSHTTYSLITSPLVPKETVSVPYDLNRVLLKFTYQPTEKHLLALRYSYDGSTYKNLLVGGYNTKERAADFRRPVHDLQLNWTYYPSDNTMNEVRILYSYADQDVTVLNKDDYTISRPSGQFGHPSNYPQQQIETRYNLVDNFSIFTGNHNIKFGFDAAYIMTTTDIYLYKPGVYIFATDAPFNPAVFSTYPVQLIYNNSPETYFENWFKTIGLFIQDSWRIHPRFTLNLGFRYSYYTAHGFDIDTMNIRNFNPRLGFSWDPVGDGKTQIRGGIGTFTNNPVLNAAQITSIMGPMDIRVRLYPGYPDPKKPNPFFPLDYTVIPAKDIYGSIDNQVAPYTVQATIGAQREVMTDLSVGADFVWAGGFRIMRLEQFNPVIPGTGNKRLDPKKGNELITTDGGRSDYKALYLTLNKRYSHGWALEVSYTLSRSYSHLNTQENVYPDSYEPDNWERQWGPVDRDARHRLAATGIFDLPLGFQLSGMFYYRTAFPWNAVYKADLNKDSLPGDYVDEQRNSRRGFDWWSLNLRISKFFNVGRFSIHPFAEVYNATNRVNFASIDPYIDGTRFGQPTAAGDPRLIQLGIRVDF